MKYQKEVEIVLSVKVKAEDSLDELTAGIVGVAIMKILNSPRVAILSPHFEVTVKHVPTEAERPWTRIKYQLAKARSALAQAWDQVA